MKWEQREAFLRRMMKALICQQVEVRVIKAVSMLRESVPLALALALALASAALLAGSDKARERVIKAGIEAAQGYVESVLRSALREGQGTFAPRLPPQEARGRGLAVSRWRGGVMGHGAEKAQVAACGPEGKRQKERAA